ncbi:MAG: hypothetical protein SGJ24_05380 [Chloroflexota bacterium]|nr:hypothetical protein [Chloroflexota bacterium]
MTGLIGRIALALLIAGIGAIGLALTLGGANPNSTILYARRTPDATASFDLFVHDIAHGLILNVTRTRYGDEPDWDMVPGSTKIVVARTYPGTVEVCIVGMSCYAPPFSRYDRDPRFSPDGTRLAVRIVGGAVVLRDLTTDAIAIYGRPFGSWLWTLYDLRRGRTQGAVRIALDESGGQYRIVIIGADGIVTPIVQGNAEIKGVTWMR